MGHRGYPRARAPPRLPPARRRGAPRWSSMRREPAVSFDPDLSKRAALFAALLLAALTLAAYLPALSAGFVWDDDDYVYKNYLLWEPDGLFRIWFTADA